MASSTFPPGVKFLCLLWYRPAVMQSRILHPPICRPYTITENTSLASLRVLIFLRPIFKVVEATAVQ